MTIKHYSQFQNFHEIDHPLVKHKLSMLRDVNTNKKTFNELVNEITLLLVYEVTRNVPLTTQTIQTPLEEFAAPVIASSKKPVILPILRAGIGMVDAFLSLMPHARVGHIGLYRDESTMQPQEYYFKIPTQSEQRQFYICDPMLATGGSAITTINELKARKVSKIKFVCLVAAPEGVARLNQAHPDVAIYAANLDRELNQNCYILPGLGDAGDRLFGTK